MNRLPGGPVLIDGPTGTELERRGFSLPAPLWSAAAVDLAPDLLVSIHSDYLRSGAEVITANTFRTNPATLASAGGSIGDARRMTARAVSLARRAIGQHAPLLAGSVAPVGDCYSPSDQRSEKEIRRDHRLHIQHLISAGCDLLLLETMNSLPEAVIALEEAVRHDTPVAISLVTDRTGLTLLDGTDLREGVTALKGLNPSAILLNCASPEATVHGVTLLATIAADANNSWAFGGYPNSGEPDPDAGWDLVRPVTKSEFDSAIDRLLDTGATWVGSCCGTTPDTTARIRKRLDLRSGAKSLPS